MGHGIAFQHPYRLLFYGEDLHEYEDENGETCWEEDYWIRQENCDYFYEHLCEIFNIHYERKSIWHPDYRDVRILGSSDRFYLCVEYNGDNVGCLFLDPKTYERGIYPEQTEYYYILRRDSEKYFNKLIRNYAPGFWKFWTTAYTAQAYKISDKTVGKYVAPQLKTNKVEYGIAW